MQVFIVVTYFDNFWRIVALRAGATFSNCLVKLSIGEIQPLKSTLLNGLNVNIRSDFLKAPLKSVET